MVGDREAATVVVDGVRLAYEEWGMGPPLLFVHGDADTLIPPELGRALYDAAGGPKTWLAVRGGTHDVDDAEAWSAVRRFCVHP